MRKIIVAGSINTDLVIRAPYLPAKGQTLTGSGFFTAHGGKGANQAVAAARLGGKVAMCGCVGNDDFGKAALNALKTDGIDVSRIRTVADAPTGTAVILLTEGDNRIILDKGANDRLSPADIDAALAGARTGDIFLIQQEIPLPTVLYALKAARAAGMFVILNPAPADHGVAPALPLCDLVVPNETEAALLGGAEALAQVCGSVIVTLGERGFELLQNGQRETHPCIPVQTVDTTAAGDTFCGGLAARLSLGDGLSEAARYAGLAASIACTRPGAQPSVPTAAQVAAWKN